MSGARRLALGVLLSGVLLLCGCPLADNSGGDGLTTIPISHPSSSDNGDDLVGPPVGDSSADANTPATSASGDSPVAVGGDTAVAAAPDALSVTFPGCEDPATGVVWRAEVLRLVNQERTQRGTAAVTWNQTLADQATEYACELIGYDYFDHVNPFTGSTLATRTTDSGYKYWIVGENLAAGQRTPAEVVAAWMNSPCHRQNVLNPAFTELGVGIRYGGDYGYYWVQEFGRPLAAAPNPAPDYHDPDCTH
jgi:uncharacterized protein YkwD